MGDRPTPAGPVERFVVQLDVFPLGALLRTAIGYAAVPAFRQLVGRGVNDWRIVPWFLIVLVAVRVVPAFLRIPFPRSAKIVWVERRDIAKRFDSYQWRKLLWFGLGIAAYAAASSGDAVSIALGAVVLVAGCLGEYEWRRSGARILASERR